MAEPAFRYLGQPWESGARADLQKADLKTFTALGCYGASVVTVLTAQNTKGVQDVYTIPPQFVERQVRMRTQVLPRTIRPHSHGYNRLICPRAAPIRAGRHPRRSHQNGSALNHDHRTCSRTCAARPARSASATAAAASRRPGVRVDVRAHAY